MSSIFEGRDKSTYSDFMPVERDELIALYALYLSDGIGNVRAVALREYFGSAERAFGARRAELLAISGFGEQTVTAFADHRQESLRRAKADLDALPDEVHCITYFDDNYPAILKSVYSPPLMLFVRGNAGLLHRERNVAIVGTRRMTIEYGKAVTKEIAGGLAQAGVCVTSGFALGVDTCAHRAAFDAGGETIAVLGTGIDSVYPASNKRFAGELASSERGALVSEFPIGTPADAKNFPWRNRIVCGLARACIVVESDEKGGSMITAGIARDQGRILYAVPGDIYRTTSKGPNLLLASRRAYPVRGASDVLKDMGWNGIVPATPEKSSNNREKLTFMESAIVTALDAAGAPIHIDILSERAEIGIQDLLVHLLDLEFRDIVRQLPGKYFSTIF